MEKTPIFTFLVGKRVKDDNVPYHFQEIDPYEYRPKKPVVLVLGGKGTDDNHMANGYAKFVSGLHNHMANGYAKFVSGLLGVFSDEVDILSVNYHRGLETYDYENQNTKRLAKTLFLPAVSKNNAKIEVDEACKNLRQFTVFAHCNGDRVLNKMVNFLEENLVKLGYTESECLKILKQIFLVSYGTMSTNPIINIVNSISPFDEMYGSGKQIWKLLLAKIEESNISPNDKKELEQALMAKDPNIPLKKFYANNHRCYVLKLDNEIHLASTMHYSGYEIEHSVIGLSRTENYKPHRSASPAGDCVSKCLGAALCNAVANSMQNKFSKTVIPVNMEYLASQLEEITKPLNSKELKDEQPMF